MGGKIKAVVKNPIPVQYAQPIAQLQQKALSEITTTPSPSIVISNKPKASENILAATDKTKEFTIYTGLPSDEPTIIASTEFLQVGATETNAFSEADSRRSALLTKDLAINQIIAEASHVILEKIATTDKIQDNKKRYKQIADLQVQYSKLILNSVVSIIRSLDIRASSIDDFKNLLLKEKIIDNASSFDQLKNSYTNTSSYLVALSILKKILHTHSARRFDSIQPIIVPTPVNTKILKKTIAESIVPNFTIAEKNGPRPNLIFNTSNLSTIDKNFDSKINNYLRSHVVLNNQSYSSLAQIASLISDQEAILKTFSTNQKFQSSPKNLLKFSTAGLLNALDEGGVSSLISTNKNENKDTLGGKSTNYFGALAFLLFKEIYFSIAAKAKSKDFAIINGGTDLSLSTLGSTNYDVWENFIGEIQPSIVDFVETDRVAQSTTQTTPLSKLSKQITTTNTNGIEQEFRVLSLEAHDIPSIDETAQALTLGSIYHVEGALAGNPTTVTIDGSTFQGYAPDPEKLKTLVNRADSCRILTKSLDVILNQNQGSFTNFNATLGMLGAASNNHITAIPDVLKKTLGPWYKKSRQNSTKTGTLNESKWITYNFYDLQNSAKSEVPKELILSSIIKYAWNLAYSPGGVNIESKRLLGEKLLKALFVYFTNVATAAGGQKPIFTFKYESLGKEIKDKRQSFSTLINETGNVNSVDLAIDALIGSNTTYREYFGNSKSNAKDSSAEDCSIKTKIDVFLKYEGKVPNNETHSKVQFAKVVAGTYTVKQSDNDGESAIPLAHFVVDGKSYFEKIANIEDNLLTKDIVKLLSDFGTAEFYRTQLAVLASELIEIETRNVHTTYFGNVERAAMMWNYFLLIADSVRRLTTFEIDGFYNREISNGAIVTYTRGYVLRTTPGNNTIDGKYILKQVGPYYSQPGLSQDLAKLDFNVEVYDSINNIIQEETNYLLNATNLVKNFYSKLKNNLSTLDAVFKDPLFARFYNEINAAVNSEKSPDLSQDVSAQRSKYLVSQAVSQEQLILSSHAAHEISNRFAVANYDLNEIASSKLNPYIQYNSRETFVKDSLFDYQDLLPLNSVQPYILPLVLGYFSKNYSFQGFVSDNKRILSVGIPPRMIRKLTGTELQEGISASDTAAKNIIAIKVYLNDLLIPGVAFEPRIFYFDMYRFPTRILSSYSTIPLNISGLTAQNIISSIPTKLYDASTRTFTIHQNHLDGNTIKVSALNNAIKSYDKINEATLSTGAKNDMIRNHAESFLLEEYINLFSRAQFDELQFYRYTSLDKSYANMEKQFLTYLATTENKFDKTNLLQNPDLEKASANPQQLFDLIKSKEKTARRYFMNETVFMGNDEIRKKLFLPKKFDRVFTLTVDPEEFKINEKPAGYGQGTYNNLLKKYANEGKLIKKIVGNKEVYERPKETKSSVYALEYFVEIDTLIK